MSANAVERFFETVADNEALRDQYWKAIAQTMESVMGPAIVQLAASKGYEFDVGELRQHLEERGAELSDDDLDGVVGGAGPLRGWLSNPWVLGAIVACAIAIPLAVDGDDAS
jgi:predicted ribosomally synthesized peptide with nif11-like leader